MYLELLIFIFDYQKDKFFKQLDNLFGDKQKKEIDRIYK